MPPKRKTATKIEGPSKKARSPAKSEPQPVASVSSNDLRQRFLDVLKSNAASGVANSKLKEIFGTEYTALAVVMNDLIKETRITFSRNNLSGEMFYQLVEETVAAQLQGLDSAAITVYQVIEKAGNMGIWTRDIKNQTKIQPTVVARILKALESRRLVKPIKSVTAKTKKLYLLYNLEPSKELTGGVWYSDMEFDHEFISELRGVLIQHLRKKAMTAEELLALMHKMEISKVKLEIADILQLLNTLVYDRLAEVQDGVYTAMRPIANLCDFKCWDVLDDDFQYRAIRYEDGVVLGAHEAHYQTA